MKATLAKKGEFSTYARNNRVIDERLPYSESSFIAVYGVLFASFTNGNIEGGNASVSETTIMIKERILVRENNQQRISQSG